jgi:rfaE bifunctional protein kinase chain/domain
VVPFTKERLRQLREAFYGKRIAIIGDVMLDRYLWGTVSRISPEAPVPIVEVTSSSSSLGGASNVGNNITSLDGIAVLFGVIGDDQDGKELMQKATKSGMHTSGLIVDSQRPTTVKTRVIAHSQHVVRIDSEVRRAISVETENKILNTLEANIDSVDAIILEDYNKGVLTANVIHGAIKLAKKKNKIITVDPKFDNFFEYKQVTVFKPNRSESEASLGVKITTETDRIAAGTEIRRRLDADNLLLTLGESGVALFERDGTTSTMHTTARKVADVSGAGDTVIATLTMALAAGATPKEASTLANYAGGIVCGEVGAVPIERSRLFHEMLAAVDEKEIA